MNHPIHTSIHSYKQTLPLVIIFLLLLPLQTFAEIRYVSKTGSSTPPYTSWATAADSIQKAINICNDGDTVIVANGIYKETLIIETAVSLIGLSMDSTVIDGTGLNAPLPGYEGVTIIIKANLQLENFTVKGKGAGIPLTLVLAAFEAHTSIAVKNCLIMNARDGIGVLDGNYKINNVIFKNFSTSIYKNSGSNMAYGIISDCIFLGNLNGNYITDWRGNTIIKNNISLALNSNPLHFISLSLPNNKKLENNLIIGSRSSGISIDQTIFDSVLIINNTIGYVNFSNASHAIWQPRGSPRLKINNNIIFKNRNSIGATDTNKHRTDYNLFWKNINNQTPNLIMGENDIIANPMFIKDDTIPNYPPNFDFHLQKYSPAIDAGDPNILDVDGSRSDIGVFGGPGGEAYKYIDLPPTPPKNFQIAVNHDSNRITIKWDYNTEADFNYYKIYKDTIPGFIPDSSTFYAFTDTSIFIDHYTTEKNLYFKITSVDNQENESIPGETISVIIVGVNEPQIEILREYALYQNYPNPFNRETKIIYTLKESAHVRLMVYTILGEMIKVLINEEKDEGLHEAVLRFDNSFASGIYLYRIEVIGKNNIPKFIDMKKMLMVK
jgi:hypothetical protein